MIISDGFRCAGLGVEILSLLSCVLGKRPGDPEGLIEPVFRIGSESNINRPSGASAGSGLEIAPDG